MIDQDTAPEVASRDVDGWTEIRPATGLLHGLTLRDVLAHRALAVALAQRRLKVRYKQTLIGVGWVVVQPVATVVVFSLLFGSLASLPSEGVAYPVFVLSGLTLWNYLSATVLGASASLVEDRELVTKIYFPRVIAPFAAGIPPLVDLLVSLVVLAVAMLAWGVAPGVAVLTVPVWIAALVAFASGVGLLFAALNIQYRDIGHGLPFLVQLWLFLSPVVFPSSSVDGAWRVLLSLNPMTAIIDGLRWAVLDAPGPPATDLLSLGSGAVIVIGSLLYFQSVEPRFADLV